MGKGREQMVNFMFGVFYHHYKKTRNNKKTNKPIKNGQET